VQLGNTQLPITGYRIELTEHSFNYFWIVFGILFIINIILISLRWKRRNTRIRAKVGLVLFFLSSVSTFFAVTDEDYNDSERTISFIFSLIVLFVILILLTVRSKKTREYFSTETKKEALSRQDYKCKICGRFMEYWDRDFDHKNGNRCNNKLSNCRALHPRCHRRMHALGNR
jgi:Na+/proline symporter